MEQIQYTGVNKLSKEEKEIVDKLSTEYYQRIKRSLRNLTSLTLHIKAHETEGKKKKFSIRVKAIAPTKIFETKAFDWDLARALHKVYKDMENQVISFFRTDTSYKKPYA